jgi:hypothetical protein
MVTPPHLSLQLATLSSTALASRQPLEGVVSGKQASLLLEMTRKSHEQKVLGNPKAGYSSVSTCRFTGAAVSICEGAYFVAQLLDFCFK